MLVTTLVNRKATAEITNEFLGQLTRIAPQATRAWVSDLDTCWNRTRNEKLDPLLPNRVCISKIKIVKKGDWAKLWIEGSDSIYGNQEVLQIKRVSGGYKLEADIYARGSTCMDLDESYLRLTIVTDNKLEARAGHVTLVGTVVNCESDIMHGPEPRFKKVGYTSERN